MNVYDLRTESIRLLMDTDDSCIMSHSIWVIQHESSKAESIRLLTDTDDSDIMSHSIWVIQHESSIAESIRLLTDTDDSDIMSYKAWVIKCGKYTIIDRHRWLIQYESFDMSHTTWVIRYESYNMSHWKRKVYDYWQTPMKY